MRRYIYSMLQSRQQKAAFLNIIVSATMMAIAVIVALADDKRAEWAGAVGSIMGAFGSLFAALAAVHAAQEARRIAEEDRQEARQIAEQDRQQALRIEEIKKHDSDLDRRQNAIAISWRVEPVLLVVRSIVEQKKQILQRNIDKEIQGDVMVPIKDLRFLKLDLPGMYEKVIHSSHFFDINSSTVLARLSGEMHAYSALYNQYIVTPSYDHIVQFPDILLKESPIPRNFAVVLVKKLEDIEKDARWALEGIRRYRGRKGGL